MSSSTGQLGKNHGHRRLASVAVAVACFCAAGFVSGSDSGTLQSRLEEIQVLDREGRVDQAIERYRDLLRQHPDSAEVRLGMANHLARGAKCEDWPTAESATEASVSAR